MAQNEKEQALRIFVWIVPRVNSTAFLKCMSCVDDTAVWMEPYMTTHLNKTFFNSEYKKDDQNAQRYRATMEKTMQRPETLAMMKESLAMAYEYSNITDQATFTDSWVKKQLETEDPGKKFIFIKDQSFAIFDQLDSLPEGVPTRHVFLIRHPREVYTSWKNVVTNLADPLNPIPWDECHAANDAFAIPVSELYQIHHNLWKHVKEHLDPDAVIIDGHDLTSNPDVVLRKLFENLGIPFKPSYLEWSGDPQSVYSSWRGSNFVVFENSNTVGISRAVHCSKFDPPKHPRGVANPKWKVTDELKEYIESAMPLYEEMFANRLM